MRVPSLKVVQQAAFFIEHLVSPKLDAVVHDKTRERVFPFTGYFPTFMG
jgi:hypothetical protein